MQTPASVLRVWLVGQAGGVVQVAVMSAIDEQPAAFPLIVFVPPTVITQSTRQQVLRLVLFWMVRFPPTFVRLEKEPSKEEVNAGLLIMVKLPPTLFKLKKPPKEVNAGLLVMIKSIPTLFKLVALSVPMARFSCMEPPTVIRELRLILALMALAAVLFMDRLPPTLPKEERLMVLTPVPLP